MLCSDDFHGFWRGFTRCFVMLIVYFEDQEACLCNWCHTCVNCWAYKGSVCSIQVIFDTEVKMKTSAVLVASCALFLIMASLCTTGEGFALTLSSRREQLKVAKKRQGLAEEDRMRKKLRKLENRQTELDRKVTDLKKMLKKYKSTHRSKVRFFPNLTFKFSSTIPMHCETLGLGSDREERNKI